mmetsp:Transcript_53306/g.110105  ORF Transcript_53306/g.110105 Transcript_53306/m.110105 type:complete len:220 (+) Transcript_53306:374-1033(+)
MAHRMSSGQSTTDLDSIRILALSFLLLSVVSVLESAGKSPSKEGPVSTGFVGGGAGTSGSGAARTSGSAPSIASGATWVTDSICNWYPWIKLAISSRSTTSSMAKGAPVRGFEPCWLVQSSKAALSKRYPSGVLTGSCIRAPLSWQTAFCGTPASSAVPRLASHPSPGISGGMSSSESSPCSSSASGSSPFLLDACMEKSFFLLLALFLAFRHLRCLVE